MKRKHANRPKLLNNRISLSQVTLPSTVVLEHVDNYHVNLHNLPVESLVDRETVEAYFRRRLKDERLGVRVVFDRENNWILAKFRRHESNRDTFRVLTLWPKRALLMFRACAYHTYSSLVVTVPVPVNVPYLYP